MEAETADGLEVVEEATSGVKKVSFDFDDDAEAFIFNASFDNDFRADYYDEF